MRRLAVVGRTTGVGAAACAPPTAKRQQLPEAVEKRLREVCDAVHFPACQLRSGKLTDACGLSEAIRF